MEQSEKQRSWEGTRYFLAGLVPWVPVFLAKDIVNQRVPAGLETPLLVVVVIGTCLSIVVRTVRAAVTLW
jgi:hypothetical protein